MEGCIRITDVDLKRFVAEVYNLSSPQGLGALHFTPDPLTDAEVEAILARPTAGQVVLHLDYVRGRACKMVVWRDEAGDLWIRDQWFDHQPAQLGELLSRVGCKP